MLKQIPFTHDKTSFQTIDLATCKRSVFQINTLIDISNKPEFNHFVGCEHDKQLWIVFPEFSSPFASLWYDKDNNLHLTRIGRKRILMDIVTKPS